MKKASPHIKEKTVPKLGGAYHILQHYLLSGFMADDGGIRCKTLILYAFDKDGRLEKCYPPQWFHQISMKQTLTKVELGPVLNISGCMGYSWKHLDEPILMAGSMYLLTEFGTLWCLIEDVLY